MAGRKVTYSGVGAVVAIEVDVAFEFLQFAPPFVDTVRVVDVVERSVTGFAACDVNDVGLGVVGDVAIVHAVGVEAPLVDGTAANGPSGINGGLVDFSEDGVEVDKV